MAKQIRTKQRQQNIAENIAEEQQHQQQRVVVVLQQACRSCRWEMDELMPSVDEEHGLHGWWLEFLW